MTPVDEGRDPRALPQVEDLLTLQRGRVGHREPLPLALRLRRAATEHQDTDTHGSEGDHATNSHRLPGRTPGELQTHERAPLSTITDRSNTIGIAPQMSRWGAGRLRCVRKAAAATWTRRPSEPLHPAARETLLAALRARVRRSASAPRPRPRRPAAARQRESRGGGVSGGATGRGHLHPFGHRRRAPRPARPAPAHGTTVAHSAVEHSAVVHAATWAGDAVEIPVDRRRACRPRRSAASSGGVVARAERQPRGRAPCSPSPRSPHGLDVPLFVDACASMGRLPLPRGWDALAGSAHKWGGPAGVGVLLVRKGARWVNPFPGDDRIDERASGFENVPGGAGRGGRAAGRRRRSATRSTPASPRSSTGSGPRPPDPGRRGGRRPGRPAPPPGDVLLPVRRRRGAGHRAGPAGLRRGQRLGLHRVDPHPQPGARGDGRAHPRQRPGLADPRHHRRADVDGFLAVLPEVVRDIRAAVGLCERRDLELDCRGMLCPLPVIELGKRYAEVPVGGLVAVVATDVAARTDVPGVVPDARPGVRRRGRRRRRVAALRRTPGQLIAA